MDDVFRHWVHTFFSSSLSHRASQLDGKPLIFFVSFLSLLFGLAHSCISLPFR
jgi:hypothetical protein